MITRSCSRIALLALVVAPALAGQTPAERVTVERWRDSLAGVDDTVSLKRLEATGIEHAKNNRDDPLAHVRLGFLAYRLGELTVSDDRYDDAAGEFEWAAELRPEWPYPWYGLGLAELAKGEHAIVAIENIRQQLGKDHLSKAARAFARAVQADPSFARAAIDLANAALTQRIRPRLEVAREAVRLAAGSDAGRHLDVQLARGRIERETGEVDSAIAAFQRAVEVGGDSGLSLLELARTYFFGGHGAAGRDTYFEGAGVANGAETTELLRSDLAWIASPEELAVFDSLRGAAARVDWLRRFWDRRDAADARDAGERLAEHYRRWFYARRHFRLVSRHRRYDITETFRADQRQLDDRGVVYIRHGEPDQRASFGGPGIEPNLSWLYRRPDGDLVFHFVAREDVQDYKLVESLADVLGFRAALNAQGGQPEGVAALYASRAPFGSVYQRIGDGMGSSGRLLAEERRVGRRNITVGTTLDSHRRRFDRPLGVVASDFIVGAAAPGGPTQDLHVVFAVPASRLTAITRADAALYPLQFRLLVTDSTDQVVARRDTTRVFRAASALRSGTYLIGELAVDVPAGPHTYRLLVTTPDSSVGELVTRDSLAVPTLDGMEFAVSDLVLGHVGSALRWIGPTDTVSLDPLGRIAQRGTLEIYYEVYGLARGAAYHTTVRLEKLGGGSIFSAIGRLFGGGRAPVVLEFDAPADGPVTRVRRSLDLRDTPRGHYRLTMDISDPSTGRRLTRIRHLEVVEMP